MYDHDARTEPAAVAKDSETPLDAINTDRRTMMGVAAGGLVSAVFGTTTSANATSGIGLVGSAQA
jgi:hypothetical protein